MLIVWICEGKITFAFNFAFYTLLLWICSIFVIGKKNKLISIKMELYKKYTIDLALIQCL